MALTAKDKVTFIYNSITITDVGITGYLTWKRVIKEVVTTISNEKNTNIIKSQNFIEFRITAQQRDNWNTNIKPMLDWALDGNVVDIDGNDYYLDDKIVENKPQKVSATYEKFLTWELKGA